MADAGSAPHPSADAGQGIEPPPDAQGDAGQAVPAVSQDAGMGAAVVIDEMDGGESAAVTMLDAGGATGNNGATNDAGSDETLTCADGFTADAGGCSNVNDCEGVNCNNGACVDGIDTYLCACDNGYSGTHCETNIDDCLGVNCNDGTCVDGLDTYTCACDTGFTGAHCETNIDDCFGVDCGPGTCVDLVDDFECDCSDGYQDNDDNGSCELACGTVNCGQCNMCDDSSGQVTCVCSGAAGCQSAGETCAPIYCGLNEYVDNHTCGTCEGGTYNLAGDNAFTQQNTTCDEACLVDAHCGTNGPYQVCTNNICVGCADHGDCSGSRPYCSNNNSGNGQQEQDNDMPQGGDNQEGQPGGSGPAGSADINVPGGGTNDNDICVECVTNNHCPSITGLPYCNDNECECEYDSDCDVISGFGNGDCINGSCR